MSVPRIVKQNKFEKLNFSFLYIKIHSNHMFGVAAATKKQPLWVEKTNKIRTLEPFDIQSSNLHFWGEIENFFLKWEISMLKSQFDFFNLLDMRNLQEQVKKTKFHKVKLLKFQSFNFDLKFLWNWSFSIKKKLWDLKKALGNLELEGQGGCGIIMGVTNLLLLGPSGVYRRSIFKIRPNILIGLQKLRLRPKDRSRLFIYLIF